MPFKDPEVRKANRKFKQYIYRDQERVLAIKRFRALGLDPVDIDDPNSNLMCQECLKVTFRSTPYKHKHEKYCSHYAESLPLLRYPTSLYDYA